MDWTFLLHALGGALLANGVPHFVHGLSGRPFPTPFSTPPWRGDSPPVTNLLWGFASLALGWLLIRAGVGDAPRTPGDQAAIGFGLLAAGLGLARWFSRLHDAASAGRRRR